MDNEERHVNVAFTVKENIAKRFYAYAQEKHLNRSHLVNYLLEKYLDNNDKEK